MLQLISIGVRVNLNLAHLLKVSPPILIECEVISFYLDFLFTSPAEVAFRGVGRMERTANSANNAICGAW